MPSIMAHSSSCTTVTYTRFNPSHGLGVDAMDFSAASIAMPHPLVAHWTHRHLAAVLGRHGALHRCLLHCCNPACCWTPAAILCWMAALSQRLQCWERPAQTGLMLPPAAAAALSCLSSMKSASGTCRRQDGAEHLPLASEMSALASSVVRLPHWKRPR